MTLAAAISKSVCEQINLGYRDPHRIRKEHLANREGERLLLVPKAGQVLYRLKKQRSWPCEG